MDKLFSKLEKRFHKPKLWAYIRDFLKRCKDDNVSATGAQLAYYLILSFFPFIIFFLSLMPFTPLGNQDVLANLLGFLPDSAADLVEPIINDILSNRSGTLLSTALVLSLWSASSGMNNLLKAMDLAFDVKNERAFIIKRVISLFFTLLLVLIIIVSLAGQVFGDVIVDALANTVLPADFVRIGWDILRSILPLFILTLGFALLYRFGPGFPREDMLGFREALLGGVIAAVGWTVISFGFSFYVSNFANYANTYGSIGGLIILLVWLYLSSLVIMLGAEATASYVAIFKGGLSDTGEDVPTADEKE